MNSVVNNQNSREFWKYEKQKVDIEIAKLTNRNNDLTKENSNLKVKIKQLESKIEKSNADAVDKSENYEIESLVSHKQKGKELHFLIRWKNYDSSYDQWVREKYLQCPRILNKYKRDNNLVK